MSVATLQKKSRIKFENKTTKVSSKGQITLPKLFLDNLGIKFGGFISISLNYNTIEIVNKNQVIKSKLNKIMGSVKPKIATKLNLDEQILEARNCRYEK